MASHDSPGWEPEPQKMRNWRAMFEPERGAPPISHGEMAREAEVHDDARPLDLSVYKPWVLQRGRSRPAMMLEFRRYEPRSGLWTCRAIAYPQLVEVECTGDKMLSLDFGTRHYVLEGAGLDELARYIQQGTVVTIQEHAPTLWPERPSSAMIHSIRRMDPSTGT